MTNRPFWLGVIGCAFGILLVFCGFLLMFTVDVIHNISGGASGSSVLPYIIFTAIFSALGLAASLLDNRKRLGGALMIVAATGISLSFFPFGFIPALFFLLGGILKLLEWNKQVDTKQTFDNISIQK